MMLLAALLQAENESRPFLTALLGAVVGGGGVTIVARLALTESLRSVFAAKGDAVTEVALRDKLDEREGRIEAANAKAAAELRQEVNNILNPPIARMEREHDALRKDLERAIGALDFASRQIREEGQSSTTAVAEARVAKQASEDLKALYEALNARVGGVEKTVEHISRTMDSFERSLADMKSYLARALPEPEQPKQRRSR